MKKAITYTLLTIFAVSVGYSILCPQAPTEKDDIFRSSSEGSADKKMLYLQQDQHRAQHEIKLVMPGSGEVACLQNYLMA